MRFSTEQQVELDERRKNLFLKLLKVGFFFLSRHPILIGNYDIIAMPTFSRDDAQPIFWVP